MNIILNPWYIIVEKITLNQTNDVNDYEKGDAQLFVRWDWVVLKKPRNHSILRYKQNGVISRLFCPETVAHQEMTLVEIVLDVSVCQACAGSVSHERHLSV